MGKRPGVLRQARKRAPKSAAAGKLDHANVPCVRVLQQVDRLIGREVKPPAQPLDTARHVKHLNRRRSCKADTPLSDMTLRYRMN
jgi:hypothetical protein